MYSGILELSKDFNNALLCSLYKGVLGTDVYCNVTLRIHIASGRSTPVRRGTTSAVDGVDWMDPYETLLDVPKFATSGLKFVVAQPLQCHAFQTDLSTDFLPLLLLA